MCTTDSCWHLLGSPVPGIQKRVGLAGTPACCSSPRASTRQLAARLMRWTSGHEWLGLVARSDDAGPEANCQQGCRGDKPPSREKMALHMYTRALRRSGHLLFSSLPVRFVLLLQEHSTSGEIPHVAAAQASAQASAQVCFLGGVRVGSRMSRQLLCRAPVGQHWRVVAIFQSATLAIQRAICPTWAWVLLVQRIFNRIAAAT